MSEYCPLVPGDADSAAIFRNADRDGVHRGARSSPIYRPVARMSFFSSASAFSIIARACDFAPSSSIRCQMSRIRQSTIPPRIHGDHGSEPPLIGDWNRWLFVRRIKWRP